MMQMPSQAQPAKTTVTGQKRAPLPKRDNPKKRGTRAEVVSKKAAYKPQEQGTSQKMLRLGLCCLFKELSIPFRQATVKYTTSLKDPFAYLSKLILINSESLIKAVDYCRLNGVGAFRVSSQFFPLYTFPELSYSLTDLPDYSAINTNLKTVKELKQEHDIRLVMHPDQFVVLSSPHEGVVDKSIKELEYHQFLAELVGVDVINIHAGGVYGDKKTALERFAHSFSHLSAGLKANLTIENDDKSYTPRDLLPVCHHLGIPLVYDVHHHRCNPDDMSIEQATDEAIKTWDREPLFHISSPLQGWDGPKPFRHHNYINEADFPEYWLELEGSTIEVEAKAKELAVQRLLTWLKENGAHTWEAPDERSQRKMWLPSYAANLMKDEPSEKTAVLNL